MSESELSAHCDQAQEWGLLFLNFPATNVQYGIYFQLNDLITLLINIFHIRARAARGSLVPGSRTHFLDNYSASAILHRNVVLQFVRGRLIVESFSHLTVVTLFPVDC